jgi:pimeloyl-ACP methyl ester carboxylesterase
MFLATARRAALPALLLLLALPHAAKALTWRGCPDFKGVRCSTLTVPLDRTGVDPGTIPLRIAREGHKSGPTLMYLSGGPGGAGVSEMLSVISVVQPLERRYRIIGFDQRGTGRSGLLRCPGIEKDPHLRNTAAAAQCAASLGNARKHYTTADSVQDMEAIRQALRVNRLTLFGISYGTELALEYARTYPTHVARLILDSVVDPDNRDPFGTSSYQAMTPTLQGLCPGGCRDISPDPVADLGQLVARVRVKQLRAVAYDAHGRAHKVAIGPAALDGLMFDADYDPALRAAMPAADRAALAGDGAPLARLIRAGLVFDDLGSPREFSSARYATICEEAPLPWDPGTPIGQRPAVTQQRLAAAGASAFLPFDPQTVLQDEIDLCLDWPDVPRPPPATPPPPYPDVPTLLLQGGEDLRTPPAGSAHVASLIPGSHRLVVPGVGHGVTGADISGCGPRALLRFVAGESVPTTCPRVPTDVPDVLAPPASFATLHGVPGLPLKVGRTVRAVVATLNDLAVALSPVALSDSGGGLRGGHWAAHGRRLTLDRYVAVPGVAVSGGGVRSLVMRIRGTKAAAGTITLTTQGRLTGRLGGRRIDLRLGSGASAAIARASMRPRKLSR